MYISPANIIDLNQYTGKTIDGYKNLILTNVNNHVVRMSMMTDSFYWHYHPNSDETFIVIDGILLIDLETGTIELGKGQMITIPKNMPHRTRPKGEQSVNITIELAAMATIRLDEK